MRRAEPGWLQKRLDSPIAYLDGSVAAEIRAPGRFTSICPAPAGQVKMLSLGSGSRGPAFGRGRMRAPEAPAAQALPRRSKVDNGRSPGLERLPGARRGQRHRDAAVQQPVRTRRHLLASDADSWRRRGHVFVVADGMGAHAAGELASKMAADGIPHTYYKLRDESPPDAIRKSVREANQQIHRRGQANPEFKGMGTTTDVLVILPQGALVAHVGDSRVYRLRGTKLEQLTFDHSLVWEMSASGQFADGAAVNLVPKNIITRSLGPHAHVQVDLEGPYPIEMGDTFLLCTDGLTGLVKDEEIGVILGVLPPGEAAQVLIDLANLRGGPDNITVIVVRATGPAITWQGTGPVEPLALADERAARAAAKAGPSKTYWALGRGGGDRGNRPNPMELDCGAGGRDGGRAADHLGHLAAIRSAAGAPLFGPGGAAGARAVYGLRLPTQ